MRRGEALRILELDTYASFDQIRANYRLLAMVWHPDRFESGELKAKAEAKLKLINAAWETLRDGAASTNTSRKDQNYDTLLCDCGQLLKFPVELKVIRCARCGKVYSFDPDADFGDDYAYESESSGATAEDSMPEDPYFQTARYSSSSLGCSNEVEGAILGGLIGALGGGIGFVPGAIIGYFIGGEAIKHFFQALFSTLLGCACCLGILIVIGVIFEVVSSR
jgi:hypothetical protein